MSSHGQRGRDRREARYVIPALPAGTIANVFAVAELSIVYRVAQLNDGTTVRINPS